MGKKSFKLLIRLALSLTIPFFILSGFAIAESELQNQGVKVVSKKSQPKEIDIHGNKIIPSNLSIKRQQKALKQRQKNKQNKTKAARKNEVISSRADLFSIYDAWVSLDKDYDGDGYYSEVSINVDADYEGLSANVFMAIYVSLDGESWEYFDSSETFSIYSDEQDIYSLSFDLNRGYPSGNYHFLIELYEEDFPGVVDLAGPLDLVGLLDKPLEDKERELSGYSVISYVASALSFDHDYDDYYTRLILEYDIETTEPRKQVYTQVVFTDRINNEQTAVYTESFILDNQTEVIEVDFDSGYYPSYYDVQIYLVDALSNETIAYADNDFSSLNRLKIESTDYDDYDDSGSFGILIGWLLLTLLLIRFLSESRKDNK